MTDVGAKEEGEKIENKAGISFVCRCHNEAAVLEESLKSLQGITRPFEIVLVLHRCTDASKEIAEKMAETMPIKIYEYEDPISRAGYENLVTDASDSHSFAGYTTWCFNKAAYKWKFKWDADFIATTDLTAYINHDEIFETEKGVVVYLPASNDDAVNTEAYMFNCLARYGKYVFWEVPLFHRGHETIRIAYGVTHCSSLKEMKPYWKHTPWFMAENEKEARADLIRKYEFIVEQYGAEKDGACRANDKACAAAFHRCKKEENLLANEGIFLYK